MSKLILANDRWKDNSYLIEDIARLRWIRKNKLTLDPTFGKGIWWKRWCPYRVVVHDVELDGLDFRDLPYPNGTFPQIAFDPPYVSMGGRATTQIKEFYERYGLMGAPTSPERLQSLCDDGLSEMYRLLAPKGIVIVKSMSYVSSGKLFLGDINTYNHAISLGLRCEDRFIFNGHARAQPKRTKKGKNGERVKSRQHHARNNASTMFVFRKVA